MKLRLYPVEYLTIFSVFLVVIFFGLLGIGFRYQPLFYLAQFLGALDNYIILLLITALVVTVRTLWHRDSVSATAQRFRVAYWNPAALLHDTRHIVAILLLLAATAHLKHLTPLVSTKLFDAALLHGEQVLFGGKLAGPWLHNLLGTGSAAIWSTGYLAYYLYMNTIFLIFIVQRNRPLGQEFCLAFGLTWLIGTLAIWLLPTWGPCFFAPELYTSLPPTDVGRLQQHLWFQREALVQNPGHPTALFLISGFPSLHLAVVLLGSLYLHTLSRFLALISWCFTGVTMVTTLYFGWHYLVDNVGSIVLVLLARWLAHRFLAQRPLSN